MNKILIIEDDKTKIEKLKVLFFDKDLTFKESFKSGVSELKSNFSGYNLLILDMTIPLWEKGNNDLGGNYEQWGGERILREIKRHKLNIPTILFTMFDVFPTMDGTLTFEELNMMFLKNFPEFYLGGVFYSANEDKWKNEIFDLITKIQ